MNNDYFINALMKLTCFNIVHRKSIFETEYLLKFNILK